ncbi:hypothetical protein P692DRAFT_20816055 [Suillus brevipes Sb2]|nr:hypothetical protein P692DRAFT_20816055 [Suillus brevipes Sb2]
MLHEPGLQRWCPLSFPLHVLLEVVNWRPQGLTVDHHSQQKLEVEFPIASWEQWRCMVKVNGPWTRNSLKWADEVLRVGKDLPIDSTGETANGKKPDDEESGLANSSQDEMVGIEKSQWQGQGARDGWMCRGCDSGRLHVKGFGCGSVATKIYPNEQINLERGTFGDEQIDLEKVIVTNE